MYLFSACKCHNYNILHAFVTLQSKQNLNLGIKSKNIIVFECHITEKVLLSERLVNQKTDIKGANGTNGCL